MLETARVFIANSEIRLAAPIIFLFNGAEETLSQAAHGFMAHDRYIAFQLTFCSLYTLCMAFGPSNMRYVIVACSRPPSSPRFQHIMRCVYVAHHDKLSAHYLVLTRAAVGLLFQSPVHGELLVCPNWFCAHAKQTFFVEGLISHCSSVGLKLDPMATVCLFLALLCRAFAWGSPESKFRLCTVC